MGHGIDTQTDGSQHRFFMPPLGGADIKRLRWHEIRAYQWILRQRPYTTTSPSIKSKSYIASAYTYDVYTAVIDHLAAMHPQVPIECVLSALFFRMWNASELQFVNMFKWMYTWSYTARRRRIEVRNRAVLVLGLRWICAPMIIGYWAGVLLLLLLFRDAIVCSGVRAQRDTVVNRIRVLFHLGWITLLVFFHRILTFKLMISSQYAYVHRRLSEMKHKSTFCGP